MTLVGSYHRGLGFCPALARLLQRLPFRRGSRVQVDVKRKDVGRKDKGNDPFQHGACVVVFGGCAGHEGDGEENLDDDERELDVEGHAQDAVFAVAWSRGVG